MVSRAPGTRRTPFGVCNTPTEYFLSYSRADANEFAVRLYHALRAGPPKIAVWFDQYRLQPGRGWDAQIEEAIAACRGLLFILTADSASELSECSGERQWGHASA